MNNIVPSGASPRACRYGTPPPYKYGGSPTPLQGGASCIYTDSQVIPAEPFCQGYINAYRALDFNWLLAIFVANRFKPKKIAPLRPLKQRKENFCGNFLVSNLESF